MKDWTRVIAGDFTVANLGSGGMGDNTANSMFTEDLAQLMVNGGHALSTQQEFAQEIMGKNFFGVMDAVKYLGANVRRKHLDAFAEVPFSEAVLRYCRDTHILVAVLPMSILDIRDITKKEQTTETIFYPYDWYDNQVFAKNKGNVSWQLVRKDPVVGSVLKTWNNQQALLSIYEVTPTARIVVYAVVGHFLACGERLFEKTYVRCADCDSDGYYINSGFFTPKGLRLNSNRGEFCFGDVRLSAAMKLPARSEVPGSLLL